jgi:hypothetical protein
VATVPVPSRCDRLPLVDVVQLAFGGEELVELWPSRPFKALRECEAIHPARANDCAVPQHLHQPPPRNGLFPSGACEGRKGAGVFRERLAIHATIDELTSSARFDQARVRENLQMVRDCCGSDTAQRDNFPAIHFVGLADGLENEQARSIGQGLGNAFDVGTVHL